MLTKTFVCAGNATFSVKCPDGQHYTYRVRRTEPTAKYPNPAYFVSLLTGPDNTADYTYLGRLDDFTGSVTTTAKSKLPADSFPIRLLNRVLLRVWGDQQYLITEAGYSLHNEGRCGRCGRTLTVPSSVDAGIGPDCAKMMGLVAVQPAKQANRKDESGFVSDGLSTKGLSPNYNKENELTHWTGVRNGVQVTVWNT